MRLFSKLQVSRLFRQGWTMPRKNMYLFKEELFMYLFVFKYLFIYLPHYHYGNCKTERCLSTNIVRGGWNKRLCGRDKKRILKGNKLRQKKHLRHIKVIFWKIFVIIFYNHFCKITNLRLLEGKQRQTEWGSRWKKEVQKKRDLQGHFECFGLTYFLLHISHS